MPVSHPRTSTSRRQCIYKCSTLFGVLTALSPTGRYTRSSGSNQGAVVATSSKHRKLLQYLLFAAVVIWIAVGLQSWNNDTGAVKAPRDRKPVPDVALPQLDGNSTWRLSDHQGQVVLINYWATWCAPCRQ